MADGELLGELGEEFIDLHDEEEDNEEDDEEYSFSSSPLFIGNGTALEMTASAAEPQPTITTVTEQQVFNALLPSLQGASGAAAAAAVSMSSTWDPVSSPDWDLVKPTEQCFLRIKRDIMSIYNDPPPGMFIVPDKDDMTILHALITGPFDTPYEGGFFYFYMRCPPDYPIRPPRIRLMSTGGGRVRFNPNLYKNGKVCLSILGTWSGPAWSPALSLASLLMSIQSLMNEKPYHNEPGFEQERASGDAQRYNEIIRHETLRVAVCDMLEGLTPCPDSLKDVMEKSFLECCSYYESTCSSHQHLNGMQMHDPFGEKRGIFDYVGLSRRIEAIRIRLAATAIASGDDRSDEDTESEDISDD